MLKYIVLFHPQWAFLGTMIYTNYIKEENQ